MHWLEYCLASHQCGPGLIPGLGVRCGLSLLLVLVPALRSFSLGPTVSPSPQKPTFLNSNFNLDTVDKERPCGCATAISHLFIVFICLVFILCCKTSYAIIMLFSSS